MEPGAQALDPAVGLEGVFHGDHAVVSGDEDGGAIAKPAAQDGFEQVADTSVDAGQRSVNCGKPVSAFFAIICSKASNAITYSSRFKASELKTPSLLNIYLVILQLSYHFSLIYLNMVAHTSSISLIYRGVRQATSNYQ